MAKNGRDDRGRFARGNPGGPGRPRRSIEIEYLGAISDGGILAHWSEIVAQARDDARAGDWRAREWLSRYLVGIESPPSLVDLASAEDGSKTTEEAACELIRERAFAKDARKVACQLDPSLGP